MKGIQRVMGHLGMLPESRKKHPATVIATRSSWVRARRSGLLRLQTRLGDRVGKGQRIGWIADAFGGDAVDLRAPFAGIVIGESRNPVVHRGDAVAHIAEASRADGR